MLPAPLAGVRVLDLSQVISGPICGRVLADLGADVVKVESPAGDISRRVPPHVAPDTGLYFSQANAGKRAVCIDLRADAGADLVRRLVACCDVLIENFRPGVLARRGLGADELLAAHPRLVYCSISGWGQDGPWAQRRAYAPLVHAEAGRIELAARLRGTPPQQEVHVHGDI
jgi:crotonobetainyl-CoA:carnitine CoA-transferase CaiB-like acyl-CoA transferase